MSRLAGAHKRIDFHHHFQLDPGVVSLEDKIASTKASGWPYPEDRTPWTPELSLRAMDDLGIEIAILSPIQAGNQVRGRTGGAAADLSLLGQAHLALNELARSAVDRYPDRFGFFASLPLEDGPEASLKELVRALDELGADGVHLPSSYGTGDGAIYVGADVLDGLWAELDRRGSLVFIHGSQTKSVNGLLNDYAPTAVTEVGNETFKAAADLVTRGKRRLFPNVKIILSHSGGATPVLAARTAVLSNYLGSQLSPEEIIDDFRTFFYETALSGFDTNLVALEDLAGLNRILFGTDFPAVEAKMSAWYANRVDEYYRNRPADLSRIMRGTALALLPRFG